VPGRQHNIAWLAIAFILIARGWDLDKLRFAVRVCSVNTIQTNQKDIAACQTEHYGKLNQIADLGALEAKYRRAQLTVTEKIIQTL
jgi:hypothetical protein